MNKKSQSRKEPVREIKKPFLTGSITDENTIKNSLAFFGIMIIVLFISLIACVSASFSSFILRAAVNSAVILVLLMLFFNTGAGKGADAVARGEILYQKKEKGESFSESERRICFHPMKGYLNGLIGTIPFLIPAVILAIKTTIQVTGPGTLPSWMQTYTRRGEIGNALAVYTQPEGMAALDYIRALVRVCIIPYVNIVGNTNKEGMLLLERLSPVIMLFPAIAYGTGYLRGRNIRSRIHTAISENNKKRIRREKKRRAARARSTREPEQLN